MGSQSEFFFQHRADISLAVLHADYAHDAPGDEIVDAHFGKAFDRAGAQSS
jgi:hypothetical protein